MVRARRARVRSRVRARRPLRGPADAGAADRDQGARPARPAAVGGVPGRARERDRPAPRRRPVRRRAVPHPRHPRGPARQDLADAQQARAARGRVRGAARIQAPARARVLRRLPRGRAARRASQARHRGRARAAHAARLRPAAVGLARYFLPARRTIVLRLTLSRTLTTPVLTRVSVPAQESWTSHSVPRTVAALYWPRVRKEPEPLPQSLRLLGLWAAIRAPPQRASGSVSVRSVVVFVCVSLKMLSWKVAVWPALAVREIVPLRVSIVEPSGMLWVPSSST